MTAAALKGEQERCLAAGMDDYLSKPITMDRLASMLKRWIPENHGGPNATSAAPAPPAASAEPDPFDDDTVACLREVMANRPGGFAGLVTSFVEDAARSLAAVRAALLAHDTATVRRELHTITGTAATIGADQLARACSIAEQDLTGEPKSMEPEVITPVEAEFRRVAAWVSQQPQE